MRDWKEIENSWDNMVSMSCRPINLKLKEGTVIDENKSVHDLMDFFLEVSSL